MPSYNHAKKKSVKEKIILVVSKHRQFGWKFNIYWAEELPSGSVKILGIPDTKEEELKGASETDIKLIKLIDEVSDTALMKAYSKKKSTVNFRDEISQETINNLIRPRIEINVRKVVELALISTLPVYLREDLTSKTLYERYKIEILPTPTRCLFNFVKDEKGLRYFISLTNNENEISLQEKPAYVLSQEPCVILLGDKIHRVENIESKKLVPFFDKGHIDVPASSEKMYIKNFILKTIPKYEVKIDGIEMTEIFPDKKALLILEEDFYQQLTFFLYFQYNDHRVNPAQRKTKFVGLEEINREESICWFIRDLDWEKRLTQQLLNLELRQESDNRFYLKQNPELLQRYGLIGWLNNHKEELSGFVIEQKTGQTYYTGNISMQSKLDTKIDWFDVEIEVIFDNFKIPFSRFRKHILNGNIEFILPDHRVFILPEEWFQRYHDFFLHGKETGQGIRVQKMHVGILNESINELFSEKKKQELLKFKQLPEEQPIPPPHLNALLRPYQKEGFYWLEHLYNVGLGGCLADDMGLGKTLQTITLLDYIYSKSGKTEAAPDFNVQLSLFSASESTLPASLIVVPKSLLHNWQNELKRFAPDLKVLIYAGNKRIKTKDIEKIFRHYQVIITSYGMVRTDMEFLKGYPFHYIILDESQYIKNPESIVYKSVKNLYSTHKLALTGTPIENSLSDLWAQFNFINPGLLGNFSSFKSNYIQKITKEKNKYTEEALLRLIQPFLLRRTKEQVTPDLPPLSQEIVYCDMTENQQEIYDAEKNRIRNVLLESKENLTPNNFVALQGLMRLRLLANHPSLIDSEYAEDSGKFDQIILYFESLKASGHKVLIFSSFVKHLKLLSKRFEQEGWKYALLTGQTANREAEINKFIQNDDINCFFISLKAGGTGLNLTVADYVFIIDPWWNPAAEMQALSRAHRIGQDKNVMVYRFISSDTIEEKIILLQQSKLQLSDTFITSNSPLEQLNNHEIAELFL